MKYADTALTSLEGASHRLGTAVRRVGSWLYGDRAAQVLLLSIAIYAVAWSWISIERYYALAASVDDLGSQMQSLWNFAQPGSAPVLEYVVDAFEWPSFFLLSPLALPQSFPLLLTFQSVCLGSAALPIYVIARWELRSRFPALCLALAYLVYFPLAGANWFDFHVEVLFIPLFLFGYAFYLLGWRTAAFLLLGLAAIIYFPYELLVLLFGVLLLVQLLCRRYLEHAGVERGEVLFAVGLIAVSAFFAVVHAVALFQNGGSPALAQAVHATGTTSTSEGVALALILLLVPVLFLPLLSPRWLVMMAPFAYLATTTGYYGFDYPALFQLQYVALFIPFVFLGTIEAVAFLSEVREPERPAVPALEQLRSRMGMQRRDERVKFQLALSVLIVTLLLTTVFEPYGPYNGQGSATFGYAEATAVNWTTYEELEHLVGLIPRTDQQVLFQNDMPELLPRPLNGPLLVPFVTPWRNCSTYDAVHDAFPLALNQRVIDTRIDYAIDNPNDPSFFASNIENLSASMYCFARALYASGDYGILGEADGMTVLERGYGGAPVYFRPWARTLLPSDLFTGLGVPGGGGAITGSDLTDQVLWYGPYLSLSPGRYELRYSLEASNDSPANHLTLDVTADDGRTLLTPGITITGSDLSESGAWVTVEQQVTLNNTYANVEFPGEGATWEGSLSLRSIEVTQIS